MLVLARKAARKTQDADKSRVVIVKDGKTIGTIHLLYSAGGLSRLGFDFPADYIIKRDELCELGSDGKESPCVG